MRSFAVTLILLAGTLGLILWNSLYINNVTNDLLARLDSLPDVKDPACGETVGEIRQIWDKNADLIDLSANHQSIERVEMQLTLMQEAAKTENADSFAAARALLRDALRDIQQFEKMALGQIL